MFCYICGAEIKEVIVCDIVQIDGNYHYVEVVAPVLFSEELNVKTGRIFDFDFFRKEVARSYNCKLEDVKSKYIDEIVIPTDIYEKLDKKDQDLGCRCPICQDFM